MDYGNGTNILTSLVTTATVLPVTFCLNINEARLLLAAGKSAIASLASENDSSLWYCHKLPDVVE